MNWWGGAPCRHRRTPRAEIRRQAAQCGLASARKGARGSRARPRAARRADRRHGGDPEGAPPPSRRRTAPPCTRAAACTLPCTPPPQRAAASARSNARSSVPTRHPRDPHPAYPTLLPWPPPVAPPGGATGGPVAHGDSFPLTYTPGAARRRAAGARRPSGLPQELWGTPGEAENPPQPPPPNVWSLK